MNLYYVGILRLYYRNITGIVNSLTGASELSSLSEIELFSGLTLAP